MEDLKKVKENLISMIKRAEVKQDYTPQEVCNIKEAAEALYKIQIAEAMDDAAQSGDYSSMYGTAPLYHDMQNVGMYGRGRSRDSMGRYTGSYGNSNGSNGGGSYGNMPSHMYGHSIKDRMIDSLERMMDSAQSDYERQEIQQEIDRLRNGN